MNEVILSSQITKLKSEYVYFRNQGYFGQIVIVEDDIAYNLIPIYIYTPSNMRYL